MSSRQGQTVFQRAGRKNQSMLVRDQRRIDGEKAAAAAIASRVKLRGSQRRQ
jgi:hypothetical protein